MKLWSLFIGSILVAIFLAGCLSDSDLDDPENGETDQPDEGYGSVSGTIVTTGLEPIEGAMVNLVQGDDLAASGNTSANGEYTIRNVEPGEYRVQISAPCCREHAQGIQVVADEVADVSVQLEPFTADDLQKPHSEKFEWTGFLSCTVRWINPEGPHHDHNVFGVPGGASGLNVCGVYDPTGQDDFLHPFEVREGVESIVGGMTWRAPGAALGEELALLMEVNGNWNQPPRYVNEDDSSPIEFRVDSGYVLEEYEDNEEVHEYDFSNIEGTQELAYRIFAGGDVNIVYQQQFTVYWDVYYWEAAPEGASALPDA